MDDDNGDDDSMAGIYGRDGVGNEANDEMDGSGMDGGGRWVFVPRGKQEGAMETEAEAEGGAGCWDCRDCWSCWDGGCDASIGGQDGLGLDSLAC